MAIKNINATKNFTTVSRKLQNAAVSKVQILQAVHIAPILMIRHLKINVVAVVS